MTGPAVGPRPARINNAEGPCEPCRKNIGKVLPEGSSMTIEFVDRRGKLMVEVIKAGPAEKRKNELKRKPTK